MIEQKVRTYVDSENKYKITYENIYDYKNYNKLLIFLFLLMIFIYILAMIKMDN